MRINPRITALLLALAISAITVAFLSFVNGVTQSMLFVVGVAGFLVAFFLILYAIEILVYREVTKMHQTIQR